MLSLLFFEIHGVPTMLHQNAGKPIHNLAGGFLHAQVLQVQPNLLFILWQNWVNIIKVWL